MIGVDVVSISRCAQKLAIRPALANRICAPGETPPRTAAAFARRWALKEAVVKALSGAVRVTDVRITHDPTGQPHATVTRTELGDVRIAVSASDDAGIACAVACIL